MDLTTDKLYEEKSFWTFLIQNRAVVVSFLIGGLASSLIMIYLPDKALKESISVSKTSQSVVTIDENNLDTGRQSMTNNIIVEISGAILRPGVYEASESIRINDLVRMSGGFTKLADRRWLDKNLNLASKLHDSEKVYIPYLDDTEKEVLSSNAVKATGSAGSAQTGKNDSDLINVNKASLSELDGLPGIGEAYGKRIIENRPYENFDDLVKKSQVRESVLKEIKTKITF
ncbi:hypothetical protein A2716_02970 [candidate division WWE3 bacterium RIFCSPHIGHO2_01_FULL_40_23]|uniref:Soluble ligand binding domain-containing protein n=1 Tax=candidate division WWE3 bacterium RIFCSPLOWO2_01_FULL_41_18 TaxID=1802625 RepID=A0A1F4VDL3_UNCKA|nr:MAG: hypothetical protein A2716_02970 [candidate division WWE3 bacterium RIFCSPHIGHO2_01_FULL_40_23]OGC54773.1 MAG: hypothetical protein A3A78_05165 [candidate division WWE3 bacterium RIFCSPLOWO2_01_FULL_41_18]